MQTLELFIALVLLAAGNVDHQPSTPMLESGVVIGPAVKSHGQTPGATVEPGGPSLALGSILEPNGFGSLIEPNGYGPLIEPGGLSLALGSIFEPNGFGSLIEPNGLGLALGLGNEAAHIS